MRIPAVSAVFGWRRWLDAGLDERSRWPIIAGLDERSIFHDRARVFPICRVGHKGLNLVPGWPRSSALHRKRMTCSRQRLESREELMPESEANGYQDHPAYSVQLIRPSLLTDANLVSVDFWLCCVFCARLGDKKFGERLDELRLPGRFVGLFEAWTGFLLLWGIRRETTHFADPVLQNGDS